MSRGAPGIVLGYGANAWPSESLAEVRRFLAEWAAPLGRLRPGSAPLPVELRLGEALLAELAAPRAREELAAALAEAGAFFFSANCFPLGDFQAARVKEEAYRPPWTEARRLAATCRALEIFGGFVPPGGEGTLSTLAGTYRPWGDGPAEREAIAVNLARAAGCAWRRARETGRAVALCLEPEPDTTLETAADCAAFRREYLARGAGLAAFARETGLAGAAAGEALRDFLRLNYDAAHQAVMFEEPEAALRLLADSGWRVGKFHFACALALEEPGRPENFAVLGRLAEPRFLHQAVGRGAGKTAWRARDLDEVLARGPGALAGAAELRLHFHVPLFAGRMGALRATGEETARAAAAVAAAGDCRHFAVETYTWSVLGALGVEELRREGGRILPGLARELAWAEAALAGEG